MIYNLLTVFAAQAEAADIEEITEAVEDAAEAVEEVTEAAAGSAGAGRSGSFILSVICFLIICALFIYAASRVLKVLYIILTSKIRRARIVANNYYDRETSARYDDVLVAKYFEKGSEKEILLLDETMIPSAGIVATIFINRFKENDAHTIRFIAGVIKQLIISLIITVIAMIFTGVLLGI